MTDAEGAAYLIALRHVLVAEDIAQAIREHEPRARVVRAASAEEAAWAVEGVARLRVAFVAADPEGFEASALARAVAARGGRVVLMGEAAEAKGPALGFAVLRRPFDSGAVIGHLEP